MNMRQAEEEYLPWIVVFMVLFAVIFCSSSMATFVQSLHKKAPPTLNLTQSQEGEDDIGLSQYMKDSQGEEVGLSRTLWMSDETQRPIQYAYSNAEFTR